MPRERREGRRYRSKRLCEDIARKFAEILDWAKDDPGLGEESGPGLSITVEMKPA